MIHDRRSMIDDRLIRRSRMPAKAPFSLTHLLIVVLVALHLVPRLHAAQERILHNFNPAANDGGSPNGGLMMDARGNIYGTTYAGGGNFVGTVFKMVPNGKGGWAERILHSFGASKNDGTYPQAGVIMD